MSLKFDYKERGLSKLFNDYETAALEYLWGADVKQSSRNVWEYVSINDNIKVSRASVINFLNMMVDEGYLDYEDTTGKGGVRRLYSHKYSRDEFAKQIILAILGSLYTDFEQPTINAVELLLPLRNEVNRLKLSTEDIGALFHMNQMRTASIDEQYVVVVKYFGIDITRERIMELSKLLSD